jgi:HSP20 family protein
MQDNMDRIFGQMISPFQGNLASRMDTLTPIVPTMDVSETDKEVLMEIDLPGFKQDEISVEAQDRQIRVRGETKHAVGNGQEENRQYHRRERRYGFFEQIFTLPQNVEEERVSAEFKDGVLSLRLPKNEQASRGRRIPVVAEGQGQEQQRQVSQQQNTQQSGQKNEQQVPH